MTKKQALSFDYFSKRNAITLHSVCSRCRAYCDWFTFKRWLAFGRVVKKGERATRIPVFIDEGQLDSNGRVTLEKRTVWAPVFCRCQTCEK